MKLIYRLFSLLALLLVGSASLQAQDEDPFPELNYYLYQCNVTITSKIVQNGNVLKDALVAVFCGDEIRGKETVGSGTQPDIAFITVHGNYLGKYQYLTFKVFTGGKIFTFNPNPSLDWEDDCFIKYDQLVGSVKAPYIIDITPISLADRADNTDLLTSLDGQTEDVALTDRTLYKDGKWNTICLPFDVELSGSDLDGAVARPLTDAYITGTTLNLTFGDAVETLKAGTPYIIKWAKADDYDVVSADSRDITNPIFTGVTLSTETHYYDNGFSGDERVRFMGSYQSTAFDSKDRSILLMGSSNTLYYPKSGAGLGAFRAYFKIGDDDAVEARRLTAFNIDFDDEGVVTGVIDQTVLSTSESQSAVWGYTLDGRKLSAKPTMRGIYINNSKKVVLK